MIEPENAELVLPTDDVQETASYFIDRLGFKLQMIYPADAPRHAILMNDGTRICLEKGRNGDPGRLRLRNEPANADLTVPDAVPELAHMPAAQNSSDWSNGRAGMLYRDMLPGRWGGRYIVSHIRIPDGGPVPDYVHFHRVMFQMIFCLKGWVRVVYEDQGEPFVMQGGDCVLQPPEIRHRVLESSDGLEVLEIGCPAEHPTLVEHALDLPTGRFAPDRDFGGQRFLRHVAETADWQAAEGASGWSVSDLGMCTATGGLAELKRFRAEDETPMDITGASDFTYIFGLTGTATSAELDPHELTEAAGVAVPAGKRVTVRPEAGFEFLRLDL